MKPRKILMASSNSWNSYLQVGSHHLAKGLLQDGHQILFVSDPISPLHYLSPHREELIRRFEIYRRGGLRDFQNQLLAYVPGTIVSPQNKWFLKSSWIYRYWYKWSCPNIVQWVYRHGFQKVDLIYFESRLQNFWTDFIQADQTMFRLADNNAGFKNSTAALMEEQNRLIRKVDFVAYTARTLKAVALQAHPQKAFFLPNGVDFACFHPRQILLPVEYQNIPEPRAIYVGAGGFWFDENLLIQVASKLTEVSFVLIGPHRLTHLKNQNLKNVFFLGPKPHDELPNYLWHAQVGIIPLDVKQYPHLVNYIHPLKLYEYMACSLPVVSVAWKELELLKSPAMISYTADEFQKNILKALTVKNKQRLMEYARKQDWRFRIKMLYRYLGWTQ
jgi:glycosyltransferase involved in cell wall biosynthesis